MPEFHRLNKTKTTEISKEELNERLRDEVKRSAVKKKKPAQNTKRQQKLSEQTKKQMPPQSPVRKQREEERKRREKQAEKEKKKKRRRGSYIIYYILLGIVAAIIFAILSVTVLFNAEGIIVEGETIYSDEAIIEASGLSGDENLVRLNLSGIDRRITDALVSLDSAVVTKQFPNAIKITVTPAEPMANFYYAGKNYVISHVGRVMQIESDAADCMEVVGYRPGESVVVGDYITAADPEQDDMVRTINAAIEKLEFPEVTRLDITDPLSITITYEDRVVIRLGNILSIEEKLTMAKEVIERYLEPGARVSLDVTSAEQVVQRPLTSPLPETAPVSEATEDDPDAAVEPDGTEPEEGALDE
ncbi:MAG: FtsQ-type POTRA domain-containing protein [Bacteroides sp.]|nr:FtsQ-type POTRA domain-containing protein [Roseburia sp.]MCM1463387.1 FtsQ-type POTRA domain-containing protein [Bacteroides sp.]